MSIQTIVTIVGIFVGSQGLWTMLQTIWMTRNKEKSAEERLLLGMAYNIIIDTCHRYIEQGYVEADEYKELNHYLFEPYKEAGGDGTAQRLMREVENLPIKRKEGGHE